MMWKNKGPMSDEDLMRSQKGDPRKMGMPSARPMQTPQQQQPYGGLAEMLRGQSGGAVTPKEVEEAPIEDRLMIWHPGGEHLERMREFLEKGDEASGAAMQELGTTLHPEDPEAPISDEELEKWLGKKPVLEAEDYLDNLENIYAPENIRRGPRY